MKLSFALFPSTLIGTLPVALALVSGLKDAVIPDGNIAFGEIGLTGELRAVSNADQRIGEAARMGFRRIILPYHNIPSVTRRPEIDIVGVHTVREAFEEIQQKGK